MHLRPDEFILACVEAAGIGVISEMDKLIRLKDGSATAVPFVFANYDGVINPGSCGAVEIIEAVLLMEGRPIKASAIFFAGRRSFTWVVEPNEVEATKLLLYL